MKIYNDIIYLSDLFEKTFFHSFFLKFIGAFLISTTSFILPITPFLYLTAALVTADFITGIMASKRKGVKVTSSKMKHTIYKFISYAIGLLIAEGLKEVLMPSIEVSYFITFYIAATELESLDENIEKITGVSMFSGVLKKVKSFINKNES